MLLAQGFAVLMPNVRGSSGYGRAYTESDDVERRLDSVTDLAHGRHWLAAHPAIDAERIGIMGQSYGGFMVNVRDHRTSGALARRGQLLWHRRFRYAAGGHRTVAAQPSRGGIWRSGARRRVVRAHLADPSRRAHPGAGADCAWHRAILACRWARASSSSPRCRNGRSRLRT